MKIKTSRFTKSILKTSKEVKVTLPWKTQAMPSKAIRQA